MIVVDYPCYTAFEIEEACRKVDEMAEQIKYQLRSNAMRLRLERVMHTTEVVNEETELVDAIFQGEDLAIRGLCKRHSG